MLLERDKGADLLKELVRGDDVSVDWTVDITGRETGDGMELTLTFGPAQVSAQGGGCGNDAGKVGRWASDIKAAIFDQEPVTVQAVWDDPCNHLGQ